MTRKIHIVLGHVAILAWLPAAAQQLVVDRSPAPSRITPADAPRLGGPEVKGFVADHFLLGAKGEVWIIDAIRIWAAPDSTSTNSRRLEDLYERLVLFGGIESEPPAPNQPPDCDCHNLTAVKTAVPPFDSAQSQAGQIDFRNLNWWVPGGEEIQFGIMGSGREIEGGQGRHNWYDQASASGRHRLRVFDAKGKYSGPYTRNGVPLDPRLGIAVQVWAHQRPPVSVSGAVR